jgi:hypothetical protein
MTQAVLYITSRGTTLDSLSFEGANGNTGDGIQLTASLCTFRDVGVYKMGQDGIRVGEDTGGVLSNGWYFDNVKTKYNGRHGVHLSEGAGALADANAGTCVNLETQLNGGDGLYINGSQLNTFVGGIYHINDGYGVRLTQFADYNAFIGGDYEMNKSYTGNPSGPQIRFDAGASFNYFAAFTVPYAGIEFGDTFNNRNYIVTSDKLQLNSNIQFPNPRILSTDEFTLDAYQEGLWTPSVVGTSTAGTATYSARVGQYTRIGNTVNLSCYLQYTGHTGTGDMTITGLPFAAKNTTNGFQACAINVNTLTVTGQVFSSLAPATQTLVLSAVNNGTPTPLAMDASAGLIFNMTYLVD